MNSLRTLGALVVGAILLAAFYSAAIGDQQTPVGIANDDSEGVRHVVSGDRGEFSLNQDGLKIKASWRGDYALSEEGDDIASLDRKLEITRTQHEHTERILFERENDGVKRTYFRDGQKQDNNAETDAAAKALLDAFLGASGVKAPARVEILLRQGGPLAVIEKISAVYGDHARERYAAELTAQTDLNSDELRALLDALKSIESDDDLRQALSAILDNETITPQDAPMILEAAGRIESAYDLRRLIENVAEKPMNAASISLAIGLMDRIESDHDLRRAAEALLDQQTMTAQTAAQLITLAAARIDSDHDLRLLLNETSPFLTDESPAATAWIEALSSIDSDHDLRLVISDAADKDGVPDAIALALIDATQQISSDNDRRLALEGLADRAKTAPELLAAYERAARDISSGADRERALKAAGLED